MNHSAVTCDVPAGSSTHASARKGKTAVPRRSCRRCPWRPEWPTWKQPAVQPATPHIARFVSLAPARGKFWVQERARARAPKCGASPWPPSREAEVRDLDPGGTRSCAASLLSEQPRLTPDLPPTSRCGAESAPVCKVRIRTSKKLLDCWAAHSQST